MDFSIQAGQDTGIQSAIDAASAAGGGRVVLESGVHLSGTLYLKSNVELHIPAGAVLLGHAEAERYDDFRHPGFDTVTPENSRKCLIAAADCENIAVTGNGIINGQGPEFYDRNVPPGDFFAKPPWPRPRLIQFCGCRNVRIQDISLIDSPGWTCWLAACENVFISRITVSGCQQMINNDGIDIDGCRNVVISDSIFRTGDDCLVLRAIRRDKNIPAICENVTVSNCLLNSPCQGIRIGCPSDDTIRHCRFSGITFRGNGSAVLSAHPYAYLRRECTGYVDISDLSFRDFDIVSGGYPVRFFCEDGITLRRICRIEFSNFQIDSGFPVSLCGNHESVLENISLRNFSGVIRQDTPLQTRYVRGLVLDDFRITAETGEKVKFVRMPGNSWETQF